MLDRQAGRRAIAAIALATATLIASAPPAAAREDVVRSFDKTPIAVSFFPAPELKQGGHKVQQIVLKMGDHLSIDRLCARIELF
jgi:hypothetical protein